MRHRAMANALAPLRSRWVCSKKKVPNKVYNTYKNSQTIQSISFPFVTLLETRPTLPPLSSSDVTTSDANRNRRDTKAAPLSSNPNETESSSSTSSTGANVAASVTAPAAPSTDKDTGVQQQPRESGDGASAVGPDLIERSAAVTNDGRRVLSTARNGSLFDDDDDEDEDVANDNDTTTNNANSTVQSLQGIATAAVAATTATTTNSNSKKNIATLAE